MKTTGAILAALFIVACGFIGTKRELLPDNVFYSRIPGLKIKAGDDLRYKGTFYIQKMKSTATAKRTRLDCLWPG